MFCPNCGTKLPDEAMFCANCGTKLQVAPARPQPAAPVSKEPVVQAPIYEEPVTARPVAQEPVSVRPAPQPVTERPVVTREPISARPAPQPVTERPVPVREPVSARPAPAPKPAPKAPVAPIEVEDEVVAPADYTTVNVILMIVSILSCCSCVSIISFITSLIGVIFGSGCKKAIAAGDLATAQKKGKTAKVMWVISAVLLALAILFGAIVLILSFVGNSFDPAVLVDQVMSEIQ